LRLRVDVRVEGWVRVEARVEGLGLRLRVEVKG
jgi:hypothetical protein